MTLRSSSTPPASLLSTASSWSAKQTFDAGIEIGATQTLAWTGRTVLKTGSDGSLTMTNAAGNSFGLLHFGVANSSFPALKRSTTILQCRLADDSDFAPIQGLLRTAANASTGLVAGVLSALTNATIVITDASGQAYRVPCII